MKDYKKYIFDLDYTLLIPDWSLEDDYLKKNIPINQQKAFFSKKQEIIDRYEFEYSKYDLKQLSDYFKSYGFNVSEEVLKGWMIYNGETIKDEIADGVIDLLKYLKDKNKEIAILTNWFGVTQKSRLKRAGLYQYIDYIVAGEEAMKPNLKSFILAIKDTDKKDCLMIGDSIRTDKDGALNAGIDCYLVDKEHTIKDLYESIKNDNKSVEYIKRKY